MKSECAACKLIFSGLSYFDMHRTGSYGEPIREKHQTIGYTPHERRCLSVAEMLAKGMVQNEKGWWGTGETFDPTKIWQKKNVEEEEYDDAAELDRRAVV